MQLFLEDKPILLRLLEDTYYSQIIPRIICQSLLMLLGSFIFFMASVCLMLGVNCMAQLAMLSVSR